MLLVTYMVIYAIRFVCYNTFLIENGIFWCRELVLLLADVIGFCPGFSLKAAFDRH